MSDHEEKVLKKSRTLHLSVKPVPHKQNHQNGDVLTSKSVPKSPIGARNEKFLEDSLEEDFSQRRKYLKCKTVLQCIHESPSPLFKLQQLAIGQYGLVSDECRRGAWPILAGVELDNIPAKPDARRLEQHKDHDQVVLDVNRSLKRFPPGMDEVSRMAMQDQLVDVIMRVLVRNKDLHYYQGYHDICVTFLLVMGEDLAFMIIEKLSRNHLLDFMAPTMEATSELLRLIFLLLRFESPKLLKVLEDAGLEPFFALSWVLTWFGHVLGDLDRILRVYDFFLASHPLMPIYMSTAIVLHRSSEVHDCIADFAQLHHLLQNLPQNLPLERLVSMASRLFITHPPDELLAAANQIPRPLATTARRHRSLRRDWRTELSRFLSRTRLSPRMLAVIGAVVVLLFALLVAVVVRR